MFFRETIWFQTDVVGYVIDCKEIPKTEILEITTEEVVELCS